MNSNAKYDASESNECENIEQFAFAKQANFADVLIRILHKTSAKLNIKTQYSFFRFFISLGLWRLS